MTDRLTEINAALSTVASEARNVLEAYDNAEPMSDWTGAMVDTRLRAALAALDVAHTEEPSA